MIRALLAAAVLAAPVAHADAVQVSGPYVLNRDLEPGDAYMGVEYQGALKLDAVEVDGHLLGGLSALSFDADEGVLYALSDGAAVFEMVLRHDESGYLQKVEVRRASALRDSRGRPLRGRYADSEGLALRNAANGIPGDSELVVSFERRPRVLRFTPRGELLGAVALPARLRDTKRYATSNRGLETMVWHPRLGHLTAMEQPFKGTTDGTVELYALDSGHHWRYPLANEPNAGLADAVVLDDGSLLTLERGFGVFFVPFISTLRRVPSLPDTDGVVLQVETVARLNTGQGWSLDNFEGLALLDRDRVVMVSDDNRRALQATLLAQFRLLPRTPN